MPAREDNRRFPGSAFAAPIWPEQILAATWACVLGAIGNVVYGLVTSEASAQWQSAFIAGTHLLAMMMPPALLIGTAIAIAIGIIRSSPELRRLAQRRHWFRSDPGAFATALALLVTGALFFLVAQREAFHFATRFANRVYASYAMALVMVVAVALSVLLAALLRRIFLPAGRSLGRLAAPGVLVILLLLASLVLVWFVDVYEPTIFVAYPLERLSAIPITIAIYVVAVAIMRRRSRSRSRDARNAIARLVVGAAIIGITLSALTYGGPNEVKNFLERRTIFGHKLLQAYVALSDRDGDGYAFAFGGADCDDTRPEVFPGAPDPEGDGIDADCFDGDGSRDVADFGDGEYSPRPPTLDRPNFLLITIDALRSDHLGCYGYARPVSPNIDEFATEAVRFETVIAPSSRSIRSIPAMLTGFYPSQIAYGTEFIWPSIEAENVTVSEVLRQAGYDTSAIIATDYFKRSRMFLQGFRHTRQSDVYKPQRNQPIDEAIAQITEMQAAGTPWFQWVHLFNVHEPYLHDEEPSRYGTNPMDAYDTEIWYADREVGRLLDELERLGLENNTVVILTSDHGEAFGEHGNRGHCTTVFEEELRSPLLIRVPELPARVVPGTVSSIDLTPTILNLADLPVPRPMPAQSLLGLMTGERTNPNERAIYSELIPDGLFPLSQKSIHLGNYKLIWWSREDTIQLFDLSTDPGEQNDLSDDEPDRTRELLGILRAWVSQTNLPNNRQADVIRRNRLATEPTDFTRRLDLRYPNRFTVLGFNLTKTEYRPGEVIRLELFYRVDAEMDEDLLFQIDIAGPPGYRMPLNFHGYHYPLDGRYHTDEWQPGEILRDPVEIVIPREIRRPVTLQIRLRVLQDRRPLIFEGGAPNQWMEELSEIQVL